eukprot:1139002-Pelagomonas_calceolata.AAC.1
MSSKSLELSSEVSTVKITRTVTLHETSMQSNAQKLQKVVVSGKYTSVFSQEAQKYVRGISGMERKGKDYIAVPAYTQRLPQDALSRLAVNRLD